MTVHSSPLQPVAARRPVSALCCATLLALAGCGGGGGDAGGPPAGGFQATLAISTSNAKPVAADALDSATNIDAARGASNFVISAQVEPAALSSPALRLAQAASALGARRGAGTGLLLAAAVNETVACSGGGTVTVSGNVAASDGFTAGDSATLSAAGCRETIDGVLTTMSGSLALTITGGSFSATAAFPRHVAMTIQASNFSVTAGSDASTASGDVSMDLTETGPDAAAVVLTGTSLSSQVTTSAGTRSFTMRSYRQALAIAGGSTSYTVTGDFETSNSRLGTGTVAYHVSTPAALVASSAGDLSAGSLRVDGKASALLLTVTGSNALRLEVDADGNGSFESSSTATLAELQALM